MESHYGTPELRKLLKKHGQEFKEKIHLFHQFGPDQDSIVFPIFPEACRGMFCGAKTRKGTRCKNDGVGHYNGRCKFHGGASTGPKTSEGKARSSQNLIAKP
ncbi:MAG TPA: HGGxSTG domain-containing protein [Cellvibrio sp.]|nr:HGGxSTG domain-containing protein [Cellvibrio sp.]